MRATNLPAAFYTPPRPVYSAERLGPSAILAGGADQCAVDLARRRI